MAEILVLLGFSTATFSPSIKKLRPLRRRRRGTYTLLRIDSSARFTVLQSFPASSVFRCSVLRILLRNGKTSVKSRLLWSRKRHFWTNSLNIVITYIWRFKRKVKCLETSSSSLSIHIKTKKNSGYWGSWMRQKGQMRSLTLKTRGPNVFSRTIRLKAFVTRMFGIIFLVNELRLSMIPTK